MSLAEASRKVIDLARKIRDYYATELPRRYPHYPLIGPEDESVPPPPEEAELREILTELPGEIIYQLIMIMYLGRGELSTEDLPEYYQDLSGKFRDPEDAASQMMMYKATLADELSDGLEELRNHKISMEKMPLKKLKLRRR